MSFHHTSHQSITAVTYYLLVSTPLPVSFCRLSFIDRCPGFALAAYCLFFYCVSLCSTYECTLLMSVQSAIHKLVNMFQTLLNSEIMNLENLHRSEHCVHIHDLCFLSIPPKLKRKTLERVQKVRADM